MEAPLRRAFSVPGTRSNKLDKFLSAFLRMFKYQLAGLIKICNAVLDCRKFCFRLNTVCDRMHVKQLIYHWHIFIVLTTPLFINSSFKAPRVEITNPPPPPPITHQSDERVGGNSL